MALPIRTTIEDVGFICNYFAKKPMGATLVEARSILDNKYLDGRKISAYKFWELIEETSEDRYKITEDGRTIIKSEKDRALVFSKVVRRVGPYKAIVERVHHRHEDSISAIDVAAHWHQHFQSEVSENEKILNDQAVCFFQIAEGAGLGNLVVGRRGSPTRFQFDSQQVASFVDEDAIDPGAVPSKAPKGMPIVEEQDDEHEERSMPLKTNASPQEEALGQAIFIAHGKNKKPLEQLKKILEQFKIPYKVAIDEPNLGRPIGAKIQEIMRNCNCAILIFTADEEFKDVGGNTIWRPSENVVYELGATGYLYGSRLVIMKEDDVSFPSNFRDLGYITFSKDALDAKAMDVLRELIGFGIVKVST